MGDIEDLDSNTPVNVKSDNEIVVRLRKKLAKEEADKIGQPSTYDSDLPWKHTVYIKTWGCSHNSSDSEYMAGLLANSGYKITNIMDDANLWLLNSCTVKTPSENLFENMIKKGKEQNKFVVVAGCVSQAAPNEPWLKDISIIGVKQIDNVVYAVDETFKGNVVRLLSKNRTMPALNIPKMRRNQYIEILAINSGCLNTCTYCKTKQSRGNLQSYPLEELVEQARTAFERDGCKELWLTSEDLGAWGRDIGMVLPDLLKELVKVIPEGCYMRLGMTNPPYILDHLEEIAEILNHPRVYSFLHIPVQAGSDAVLLDMKREYTASNFCQIVDYLKEKVPNIYICTDFICAFPTETEEDFQESLNLVKKYEFPSLFINQFYPRPGTPAARLKKHTTVEARRRTAEMTKLFKSYFRYTLDYIGQEFEVLICERATDGIHYVGHNKSYEHILVPNDNGEDLMGKTVRVKIIEVSKFYMKSIVLAKNSQQLPWINSKSWKMSKLKSAMSNKSIKIVCLTQMFVLLYFLLRFCLKL